MNDVLLGLNVFIGLLALLIHLSPSWKRSIGIRLLASARADEVRAQSYKEFIAEYEREAVRELVPAEQR